jgi:hypothetical protein
VWAVTAIVALAYALSVGLSLRHQSPEVYIHLGRTLVNKSQASPAISSRAASYHYDGDIGFDGQYAYFLAVDPVNARYYMDSPAYRYTRVLYPLTARALALGRADLVPWTLILVNLLAIAVGTAALAAWLRRHGASAWYAMVYGFYPGVFITLMRDTTEVMAYGLVAVAIFLFDFARRGVVLSAIVFALAILTRETAAIFAIGYALAVLATPTEPRMAFLERVQRNWKRAALFVAIWAAPIAAWKIFLRWWLGSFGLDAHIERIPFLGIASWFPWNAGQVDEVRIVVVPAILCGMVAAWAIIRGIRRVETWLLLANVVILVVLLESPAYNDISSSGRITIGVVLAAMLCVPYLALRRRVFIWTAAVLWLTPMLTWFAIPTARAVLSTIKHSVLG